jgi:hypothetical protein
VPDLGAVVTPELFLVPFFFGHAVGPGLAPGTVFRPLHAFETCSSSSRMPTILLRSQTRTVRLEWLAPEAFEP